MKYTYIIMATAVVALAACNRDKKSGQNTAEQVMAMDVTEVIRDSVLVSKDYPGMLVAENTVNVVAQVNGKIISSDFKGGQYVTKGQVLMRIDPTLYANEVSEAEASLATAKANYAYAEEHYNAVSRALESNAVSKMEVSEAKSNRDQALNAIRNAESTLSTARTRLGYCTVTAPVSGHITDNIYSVGAYLAGETQPVTFATIYDDANVKVKFSIEDDVYEIIADGTLKTADYTRIPVVFNEPMPHDYTASLTYLEPAVDPQTGMLQMDAIIDNKYGELRSGMYATVKLPYESKTDALLVLAASVGTDQRGNYLYTVGDSSKIAYTSVTLGSTIADSLVIVEKGVTEGELYVTKALLKARQGEVIKPIKVAPPTLPSSGK